MHIESGVCVCVCVCVRAFACTHIFVCLPFHVHSVCAFVCVFVHMGMFVHMCVCVFVCACVCFDSMQKLVNRRTFLVHDPLSMLIQPSFFSNSYESLFYMPCLPFNCSCCFIIKKFVKLNIRCSCLHVACHV